MSPASAISPGPPPKPREQKPAQRRPTKTILIAIIALAILCVIVILLIRHWPFTQAAVLEDLREAGDSQVQVRAFHKTYFPPGCVLEGVVFDHGRDQSKPLINIDKVTIQGSYHGLFTNHVSRIIADGFRIQVPAFGTGTSLKTTESKITIGEIVANGATIEFAYQDPKIQPLRFDIHQASLENVGWSSPLTFRVRVHNPEPPGEVTAQGKFGVWNTHDPGETPISGEYKFEQADLSVYEGIAGTLSSTGKFEGKLSHIDISGATDVPDFEVKSGHHPVHLSTNYSAYVDATHGDTFLKRVDADFWKTHIVADGSIARSRNGKSKTAIINLRGQNARIEDLLLLFVQARRAPMSGHVTIQAQIEIPPGPEEFLKK